MRFILGLLGVAVLTSHAAPTNAPSNLTARFDIPTSFNLTWSDNSTDETSFEVFYRRGTTGNYTDISSRPANATNNLIVAAGYGNTYQFVVAAVINNSLVASDTLTVTTPGIGGRRFAPAVVGQAFDYTVPASSDGGAPDSFALTGPLPAGLAFDAASHQITGTPTEGGVFPLTPSVHYPNWGSLSNQLTLRVIHPPGPPVARAPVPVQAIPGTGSATTVALNDFFADPDTEQAVRFVTTKGTLNLALYATATPQTVANFLGYVTRGDYNGSVINRSVPGFVVQGGGLQPAGTNFTAIPTTPSPTNEPGVQQLRGTIAMAKQSGKANSATDQWFFNLADNSSQLDDQNGGFTAFGRICSNGITVADVIAALPTGSYAVKVGSQTNSFSDWPLDLPPPAPAALDLTKLVLLNSAALIEPLTYSVTGDAVPGLVTASITGPNLVLTSTNVFGGLTTLTLTATDLDGNSFAQPVRVEVSSGYTTWLKQAGLADAAATPGADPDSDGVPNALEFALLGAPGMPDAAAILPVPSLVTVGDQPYPAVTFNLRKNLSGATLVLQSSPTLTNPTWTPFWDSAASPAPGNVVQSSDAGDHWLLTVRDVAPVTSGSAARFVRLVMQLPP